MNRLDDYYPGGMTGADPHFYPGDSVDCECGHSRDEHDEAGESCYIDGCRCAEFIPHEPMLEQDFDDRGD